MTDVPINQKEYLKKYLAIGKAPGEKKKRKKKSIVNRVQIIDDDADVNIPSVPIEDDPLLVNEDAPQVVAVIDERPPSLRIDDKTQNPLWQPIGTVDDINPSRQKQVITGFKITPKSSDKFIRPDKSPPRRKRAVIDSHSPPREVIIKDERKSELKFDDHSPGRRSPYDDDESSLRVIKVDDGNSPPHKGKEDNVERNRVETKSDETSSSLGRRKHEDDSSPPRKKKNYGVNPSRIKESSEMEDISPPRRRKCENDNLPLRKRKENNSPLRKSKINSDDSPPVEIQHESNYLPHKIKKDLKYLKSSPGRSKESVKDRLLPEQSKGRGRVYLNYDNAPLGRKKPFDNNSSPRRTQIPYNSLSSKLKKDERSKKMEKTLDGKSAGLQNAHELIEEARNFKNREDRMFKALAKDVSGEKADTVHRDRSTGKIRNIKEEEEHQSKKQAEEEKNKEQYARWGRGLAQVESREQQLQEQLHEMSKPLARYADDEDLERYLKEQEREGDPMLAYIRKKKKKKAAEAGEVSKPHFEGEFMPNRYGIRPGHRWDGVDRSNGYEKKWFEVQNQKTALQEDSYKWSTEDM